MISVSSATIKDRGTPPRKMAAAHRKARKVAWLPVGVLFHDKMRPKRFTAAHARVAKYAKRKGTNLPESSKAWKRSTVAQKVRRSKSKNRDATEPLVFTGRTKQKTQIANITSTSKGVRVKYAGANTLNFRHPKSRVDMRREFTTLTRREIADLANEFDRSLTIELEKLG